MKPLYIVLLPLLFVLPLQTALAQQVDSTRNATGFSGSVGITNNGFSIVPAFSLNSPAFIVNVAWRKKRFSFEPDIRFVPDASKGAMLWWVRYRLVDNRKFGLRIGTHPAFTLIRRFETVNGNTEEITEMLRAIAFEIVPSYQFNKHFGASVMYLQGTGLQKNGPQLVRVLFLNTSVTDLELTEKLRFSLFPSLFFLYMDDYRGDYVTVTAVVSHRRLPFSLQSTINQTLRSDVPGNQAFMWNVGLNYNFSRKYKKVG